MNIEFFATFDDSPDGTKLSSQSVAIELRFPYIFTLIDSLNAKRAV